MSIYKRYRFSSEIIQYTVWLYYRFSLILRDVENLLVERGISVSYETIRYWCDKFGRIYRKRMKKRPTDLATPVLDEVFITIP